MKEFRVVGKPLPRLDGVDSVTGRATYTVDIVLPGLLHARLFRSPVPHAKIRRLDVSRARALPGVSAVLTANEAPAKRFGFGVQDEELFAREAVPKLARVAVLYDPAIGGSLREVKEDLPVAARALKLTLQPWEVRAADNFDRVFAALNKERPDGLYVSGSPLMKNNQKRTAGFALKSRLPSMYGNSERVDAGGFMSYGADLVDIYRRVATYMDRILKGAKPAELPVEQPKKFELVINLNAAKQIGLTIPPNVLARADRVIK